LGTYLSRSPLFALFFIATAEKRKTLQIPYLGSRFLQMGNNCQQQWRWWAE
jgi:hypothetical protein